MTIDRTYLIFTVRWFPIYVFTIPTIFLGSILTMQFI